MVLYREDPRETGMDSEDEAYQILFETQVLKYTGGLVGLGLAMWLVAVSTDYWVVIVGGPEGIPLNGTLKGETFLWSHSGLWRRCDYFRRTGGGEERKDCFFHDFDLDHNFIRVELTALVILFILILLASIFSVYSIIHLRYTYKRIAGSLHLMSAILLLLYVGLSKSQSHLYIIHRIDSNNLALKHSQVYFGFSYLLAWIVFTIFLIAAFAFFTSSRKRKHLDFDDKCALK